MKTTFPLLPLLLEVFEKCGAPKQRRKLRKRKSWLKLVLRRDDSTEHGKGKPKRPPNRIPRQ